MNLNEKKVLIVGASSGMGAALAKQLAGKGCTLALVARRREQLEELAAEIDKIAGRNLAHVYPADVTDYESVGPLFEKICGDLGGLDAVVYASGILYQVAANEYCFAKDKEVIEVNVLGAIAWLNAAAQRFERAKAGAIVGISSVAADRGRRGQPVYNASKAALDTFLEALRNRLGRYGVLVTTIKPGYVATPMIAGVKTPIPPVPVDEAASQIIKAVEEDALVRYVSARWRWIMLAIKLVPSPIMQRLNF
ncbi:MAG TPA: SDR family NAD(P)-dependent oxidoreductase [Capsulimonadaceae bacterium]|nr:SDR family NAD(P)-dependent oxidoreductase [Capsulimonadaceae bacterium]